MPHDHHFKIGGVRWLLRFTRLKGNAYGWTFFDNAANPRILVDDRLKGRQKFNTVTHELLHATLGPTVSEEAVTEAADVITRVVYTLRLWEQSNGKSET